MDKIRGTSVIFINSENKALLLLRDDKKGIPFPNCWDIPGGRVEDGESPEETIKREMLEELEMELGNPALFRVYDLHDRMEHTFWQRADFDISKIPLHEGQCLRWFTKEEINRMADDEIAFGFKSILLDFFQHIPFEKDSK
ncbi:NUDIX domain-containing protein [Candidatus Sumerlaeota bacterium]|nr:NUDIX domain-containing protein [Candidatus Sumerlaeota bacterium]